MKGFMGLCFRHAGGMKVFELWASHHTARVEAELAATLARD